MEEQKKIETEEEKEKRILNQKLIEHARRHERNMRERIQKAKKLGEWNIDEPETPYADELEWTVKEIHKIGDSVRHLERNAREIKESLNTIQSTQIEIADGIREIWQCLIMSKVNISEWNEEKFTKYIDFLKDIKEKNKGE